MTFDYNQPQYDASPPLVTIDNSVETSWSDLSIIGKQNLALWSDQANVFKSIKTFWSIRSSCQYLHIMPPGYSDPTSLSAINYSYVTIEKEIDTAKSKLQIAQSNLNDALLQNNNNAAAFAQIIINDQQKNISDLKLRQKSLLSLPFNGAFIPNITYCQLLKQRNVGGRKLP